MRACVSARIGVAERSGQLLVGDRGAARLVGRGHLAIMFLDIRQSLPEPVPAYPPLPSVMGTAMKADDASQSSF